MHRYGAMPNHPKTFSNLPLEVRAEMALKAAVEKVIVEHARQGLPIYIWRDGKVVNVSGRTARAFRQPSG